MKRLLLFSFLLSASGFSQQVELDSLLKNSPAILGKTEYLDSPFLVSGRRLYMVGHQNGSFPEIGWHIPGEMGGIWDHPIKLFDGFQAEITTSGHSIALDDASEFTNFPVASRQVFNLSEEQLKVERWQFVADTSEALLINFTIQNTSDQPQKIGLHFSIFSDLRPTWLGERTNMEDGKDVAAIQHGKILFKDSLNSWFAMIGSDQKAVKTTKIPTKYKGKGVGIKMDYEWEIPAKTTNNIQFYISGSNISERELQQNYRRFRQNLFQEIESKISKFEHLGELSRLQIPDKNLQTAFEWLKYNSEWLVQTVPGLGTGMTAGIPDYPWYFGVDSEYALRGYMAVGQEETVLQTISLLDSVSSAVNPNGRIIHEMSTNGAVFNKGNINETPQFSTLIWEIFKWNGNEAFLKKYFPTIEKGLEWLLSENDKNGNLFPDGFGMMEIHGLDSEMIDVAVYTQQGFEDAAKIAEKLGYSDKQKAYSEIARKLKTRINDRFWSEAFQSYADFIGTDEQALKLTEDAIIRADTLNKPWSVKELKNTRDYLLKNPSATARPFVLHHNWVVNTPMEMGIADPGKARMALETAVSYTNPFGVFVTGIDRDESSETGNGSFKGSKSFSYTGAVMTLPTGVQAIAENNYGNPDRALEYLQKMTRSFSYAFPGSIYEVSPDYGMITQAWTIYSYAIPIIQQFFGIDPMASEKEIHLRPLMPKAWPKASLENVKIGNNELSVFYSEENEVMNLKIVQTQENWKVIFHLPEKFSNLSIGNELQAIPPDREFVLTGKEILLKAE
ncbi:MAG: glycogen debranching protein [Christiangramia sp.]|uniref:alpha-L-rhamnosidase-related protein n=1 Tax=Christiangramia sp. TaxID=1931228 RepID=UPI003242787D